MDEILNNLEAYITAQGGSVTYADFLAQISGPAQVNIVNAARARFRFHMVYEDGSFVHYVSLKEG